MLGERRSFLGASIAFLVLAGCRQPVSLPSLPDLSTESFSPAIRNEIDSALAAAKARPDDADAVGRLGMVLHAHRQYAAARRCYRRASLLNPNDFAWLYYLGVVSQGPDSIGAFRSALRIRDYLPAKLKLGEALLSVGDAQAVKPAGLSS